MEFTAKIIADFLEGTVDGNPNTVVNSVAKIEEGKPGSLTFLANPKYLKYIYNTSSSIVLINSDLQLEKPVACTLIRVSNAYDSFAKLLELASQAKAEKVGIHKQAVVEPTAQTGDSVYVGALAYIGQDVKLGNNVKVYPQAYVGDGVSIGENTIIYAGVKIYNDCVVGRNCIIHSGTVIGSDGFGFAPQPDGSYRKIPQIGNVVIEDDVEIGANSAIDRATMGSTYIRRGVKLDNLIQIAHNVDIGANTVMAAQAGVAGSAKVGEGCMIGGQAGIVGHITIADGIKILAQSGVANSQKLKNDTILGSPAFNFKNYTRSLILFKKLPEIKAELDELRKKFDGNPPR